MNNPVILAHGFLGYHKFILWQMFAGVADAYRQRGIEVYQPLIHPTRSIKERATELKAYIEEHLHDRPFHIIGHSMGGLDARYLVSPNGLNLGNQVISLTTLATPHYGSYLAKTIPKVMKVAVAYGAWVLHYLIWDVEQKRFTQRIGENCWTALDQLQPEYMQQFNQEILDHPSVRYVSYAATRKGKPFRFSDFFRIRGYRMIYEQEGENDGMVSINHAQWGEYKGAMIADHAELIGLRIVPWLKNDFEHIPFFYRIADDLENLEQDIQTTLNR